MTATSEILAADGGLPFFPQGAPSENWPQLHSTTVSAVHKYLQESNPISVGDGSGVIFELEHALSQWLGLPYVLTTNSGTNAIYSALFALNLPAGSEVIAPVFGFHASITPAFHARLTPVLVDVEEDTGNISLEAIKRAVTPATRCVVVNHTWGHPADIANIAEFCKQNNLSLIEDCSHAYGSKHQGSMVGTFGDVAVFSMQANKMLPAGEGGFLATRNKSIFEAAVLLGHYRGRSYRDVTDPNLKQYAETGFGLKFRLHPLAAVVALSEFSWLHERIAIRRDNAARFSEGLREFEFLEPPIVRQDASMGCYFGFRPRYIPGKLTRSGQSLTCDQFVALMQSEGADIRRPSVRPLHHEPFLNSPTHVIGPMRDTWKPRLEGRFVGCETYNANRLSFPVFTAEPNSPLVEQYLGAIRKVLNSCQAPKTIEVTA